MVENMEGNGLIVRTASDSYNHFVFGSRKETTEERRSFSGRASGWINEVVKTLGGEKHRDVVKRYTDLETREAYRKTQYGLADDARTGSRGGGGAGWDKFEDALRMDMEESLQLAKDMDLLYSGVNSLVLELLKREAVSDGVTEAAPKVDVDYLAPAMQKLNAVTTGVLDQAYQTWSCEFQERKRSYLLENPETRKQLDDYNDKLLNAGQTANAQFLAALVLCQPDASKLTESELNSAIEGCREQLLSLGASLQKALAGDLEKQVETSSPVGMFV